jgi:tRNA A-37 threonylcarbamoyl transferase component Bud32/tetratricopeptide (TPR) repeat protein
VDLRTELQQHLGTAYSLGRELGGGGMSRVFVAEDARLDRTVVIKVLSPELAQGLNVERFEREIKLAASLQQANIVPLHSAGDVAGLPYFTMPYVEGESLRVRLSRDVIPIAEVITILRDVTKALAYAHARGVVHRDIKPDNVLLSGGTAVVTDFGIAKAISASRTSAGSGATLTQLGTSLGTPAYMAPEQVAGDPSVDHRADLYALGCMAFELLTGQQPFGDRSPQKMLAAHLTERAPAVTMLRPDCPPQLATLVSRLMAKDPSDRPQTAAELLPLLDAAVTTSGPAVAFSAPGMFKRALFYYAVGLVAVAVVAKAAVVGIGLPDWVFPGAILVMALGFPALLLTAYVQRVARHVATATPTLTPGGTSIARAPSGTMATMALKASPHLTWRRTTRGGYIAVGAFAGLVGLFMLLRALGIGPWGSLFAAGKLAVDDRILIGDFAVAQGDSALGPILVEAVRAALSQSNSVRLVEPSDIAQALLQMRRPRDTRLDPALARDVALRAGAKAVLGGRLARVGTGYAVSLDLTSTSGGGTLASFQGTADGPKDLLNVVDDLSRKLRSKMGESLRHVQRTVPLEQATTASLPALEKYSEAVQANDVDQDFDRAVRAGREAVALDSTFALAWRKLAVALTNSRASQAMVDTALDKAAHYADKLPDREKYLALGFYYEQSTAAADRGKALAAYQAGYQADSSSTVATREMWRLFLDRHQLDSALRYARREAAIRDEPVSQLALAGVLAAVGQPDSASALLATILRQNPEVAGSGMRIQAEWAIAGQRGQQDSVAAISLLASRSSNPTIQLNGLGRAMQDQARRGRLIRSASLDSQYSALQANRGTPSFHALQLALQDIQFRARSADGLRRLDDLITSREWTTADPRDRPYAGVARLYAIAGRPDRAQAVLARLAAEDPARSKAPDAQSDLAGARGEIALASGKSDEALREFRAAGTGPDGAPVACQACTDYDLARAFDQAGQSDSALAAFNRYLAVPMPWRFQVDWMADAAVQKRLGELYDSRNDSTDAVKHYTAFIDLWKDADPDLQPVVATVRKRVGELTSR